MHGRGPKLGSYVPLMSLKNKLKSEIFEIKNFNFYGKKMYTAASLIMAIFGTFSAIKSKKDFFRNA